ncbi:BZIP domain-containing protein [Mycena chlorophos]|uniref:BZIP domain-containing protein n=1 Tax=Mycena chlorophos TaxID=658473 RepID=A0A8H6TEI8_MYCCL|nr:BZIP domain-containing protein [Mycena chlorophos]
MAMAHTSLTSSWASTPSGASPQAASPALSSLAISAARDDNVPFEQPLTTRRSTHPASTTTIPAPKTAVSASLSQDNPLASSPAAHTHYGDHQAASIAPQSTMLNTTHNNNTYDAMAKATQAMRNIVEMTASPEFQSLGDNFAADFHEQFGAEPLFPYDDEAAAKEYLTSPQMGDMDLDPGYEFGSPLDTPYSTFLPTPVMGMAGDFDEPLVVDGQDPMLGALYAFGDDGEDVVVRVGGKLPTIPVHGNHKLETFTPSTPLLDTFDSPSASTSPVVPPPPTRRQPQRKTRVVHGATGTRKNITAASLIPLDAPIQSRTYRIPSSTSRREVPTTTTASSSSRKRSRSAAFDADDDEDDADYGVSVTEAQRILSKREKNTMAARASRRRKQEHLEELEARVEALQSEASVWRERALMAQDVLRQKGVDLQFE